MLAGAAGVFVGSCPSTLPPRVNQVFAHMAVQVATALQYLGYVGRCSFDHIVLGDPEADFTVRFTECNGRWEGPARQCTWWTVSFRARGRRRELRTSCRRSWSLCPSRTWSTRSASACSTIAPGAGSISSTTLAAVPVW